jgi:hypothetical protein
MINNELNKLKCYIQQGHKGLPGTTTPAYWAHSEVTKKMKCCAYSPRTVFTKLWYLCNLSINKNKFEYYIWMEMLSRQKRYSLFSPFRSYEENERLWIQPQTFIFYFIFLPPAKKENPMKILRRPQLDPIKPFTIVNRKLAAKKLERLPLLFIPLLVDHLWVRIYVSYSVKTLSRLMLHSEGWLLDVTTNILRLNTSLSVTNALAYCA